MLFGDLFLKRSGLILLSLSLYWPGSVYAAKSCTHLFFGQFKIEKVKRTEVQQLAAEYPQFMENVRRAKQAILGAQFSMQPIADVTEMPSRTGLRGQGNAESLAALDNPLLKNAIVAVFNDMVDKPKMAKYIERLMIEAGVYMLRNKNNRTREVQDPTRAASPNAPNLYTTKEEFLKRGRIDHQSLLYVITHRVRSRGQKIAYIMPNGNFNSNSSRTQRYATFFQVPARGPFIDGAFGGGSSHGQDVHLIQMDYVADTVAKATENKSDIFWNYATDDSVAQPQRGTWVWDTLFDGMNSTFMHPEYLGPLLRQELPVY